MKTIIIKATSEETKPRLFNVIEKLEKYIDRQIKDAVICSRYSDSTNYNEICLEIKSATKINDYDVFIVGVTDPFLDTDTMRLANKPRTLVITDAELDSAKNYIIMK